MAAPTRILRRTKKERVVDNHTPCLAQESKKNRVGGGNVKQKRNRNKGGWGVGKMDKGGKITGGTNT